MPFEWVVLWTDILLYAILASVIVFVFFIRRRPHLRQPWRIVLTRKLSAIAFVILIAFTAIAALDSVHFRYEISEATNGKVYYSADVYSLLDYLLAPIGQHAEKTYSAPFALHSYAKETIKLPNGKEQRVYPYLQYAGMHLSANDVQGVDILTKSCFAMLKALALGFLLIALFVKRHARRARESYWAAMKNVFAGRSEIALRPMLITLLMMMVFTWILLDLAHYYHVLGTDKVGKDIFYEAIKSIRTGLIIGTVTTLVMLPFALLLGTSAGYFGGWIDDTIQYVYTTLSSIPGVLLISAAVLALQIFITNHPQLFPTLAERADARLLALCVILGVTSWTGLCRLLRAETLKVREMDYVLAARSMGVAQLRVILRHILPNVLHIVIITIVLDFSALVLAEAVLSYVGVGVDPTTMSWGNMINSARLDLAREPVVWWPLFAAFVFMFTLVLAANLFADAVRDAFDPRIRHAE